MARSSRSSTLRFAVACAAVAVASAQRAQEWGYVDVRPGAHMFWWLYTVTSQPASTRPLVMWLQGGPGGCASLTCCSSPQIRLLTPLAPHPAIAASTGIGNFGEFGPLDVNQQPRNNTWLQAANLLFLDQPVGTGYSYVDNPAPGGQLTTNNTQIANDVVTLLQAFTAAFPATKTAPFFIMTESYGGKMGSAIALAILAAVDAGSLSLSFKGIGIGDSWINGVSYVDAWGPYLHAVQVFDDRDLAEYVVTSDKCDAAVAAGNWSEAINLWGDAENVIENLGDGVNFYNVIFQQDPVDNVRRRRALSARGGLSRAALAHAAPGVDAATLGRLFARHARLDGSNHPELGAPLDDLMNGPIRAQLNAGPNGKVIPDAVTWGGQSGDVFTALSNDFMKPVVANVDALLADGRVQVVVFQGQLDLICCTLGTESWMQTLTWPGLPAWQATHKVPAYAWPGGTAPTGGFVKRHGKLALWLVNNAGHLLAGDNQLMGLYMLKDIIATS